MALLNWASSTGAFIIEDDYDSEYRFEGQPVSSVAEASTIHSNVIFIGSFSKTLFPSLQVGYVVLPLGLADYFLSFRYQTDFRNSNLDQAVLCDFIVNGHLARHLRRMRTLYAGRLTALIEGGENTSVESSSFQMCGQASIPWGFSGMEWVQGKQRSWRPRRTS